MMKSLRQIPKWIAIVLIVLASIGFIDATFLTIEHYRNVIPPCTTDGCEIVLTSSYSAILGIPVALLGALYYLLLLVLLLAYIDTKNTKVLKSALIFTSLGLVAGIYFFIIQAFVIHAFCQYCLVSGFTSALLFIISMTVLYKYKDGGVEVVV